MHDWIDTDPESRCTHCNLRYKDWSDYNYLCTETP